MEIAGTADVKPFTSLLLAARIVMVKCVATNDQM